MRDSKNSKFFLGMADITQLQAVYTTENIINSLIRNVSTKVIFNPIENATPYLASEITMHSRKQPLGIKNYGSIGHLPGSRMGKGDRTCDRGQAKIATVKLRDKHDRVIVQEKLDGGNVGVALVNGILYPLTRSGYLACESSLEQHWRFSEWVYSQQDRFMAVLKDGERLCGEWLLQAHGTRYHLQHEPFVAFDLMNGNTRTPHAAFLER